MKALVDMDIIPYEIGNVLDETVSIRKVLESTDKKIEEILNRSGSSSYVGFLTESRTNFRIGEATVAPYKGHRSSEKPYHWTNIRNHILENYHVEVAVGCEADDLIGDECLKDIENTIICSRDKDMDTIPGWHYRWKCGERQPEKRYYVNDFEARYFFYYQMLVGDQADNIKGIVGVGDKKAKKILEGCDTEEEMLQGVKEAYIGIYGGGSNEEIYYELPDKTRIWKRPTDIMKEMAELLWIGTDRNYLRRFDIA